MGRMVNDTKIETVSIVYQPPKILLGMKKVRFGKGKYNGFGGGVEEWETIEQSAIRETYDESGIKIINPIEMGKILFEFDSDEEDHLVYFFKATKYKGTPEESDEMKPEWFHENNIPYDKMWPNDKYWLPLLLQGKRFRGNFKFDLENKIRDYELYEEAA
jgi:8-oxo-dGTP diphosphatase / 2-hydroxy-dATP diphosphatase